MKVRSFVSMTTLLIFMSVALTGIVRFLDESPVVATFHMTFAFSFLAMIYFHIYNNWSKLWSYIKDDKKEFFYAVSVLILIAIMAYIFHHFSFTSQVI